MLVRPSSVVRRYVGPVDYTSGTFVGVEFDADDAGGKHSGVVKGKEYFDAAPKRGLMVQPSDVQLDGADYRQMPVVDKPPKKPTAAISYARAARVSPFDAPRRGWDAEDPLTRRGG